MGWLILSIAGVLGGNLAGWAFRSLNQGLRMNSVMGLVGSGLGAGIMAAVGMPGALPNGEASSGLHSFVLGGLGGAVLLLVFAGLRNAMIR